MRRRHLWIPIILVAGVFIYYASAPRSGSLLARAERVPGYAFPGNSWCSRCAWESDNVAIVSLSNAVQRLDIVTGQVSTMPAGAASKLAVTRSTRSCAISPDGRWRLAIDTRTKPRTLRVSAADGTPKIAWQDHGGSEHLYWRPDGAGIVQYATAPLGIITYHLDDPNPKRIPLSIPRQYLPIACTNQDHLIVYPASRTAFGVTPPLYEISPESPESIRRIPCALPDKCEVNSVEASPRGDRLLWWLAFPKNAVIQTWLDRLLRMLRVAANGDPRYSSEGLWVSGIDGSGLREIGQVKAEYAPAGLHTPGWMPDGRRAFFFYRHGMYTVPVD